MVAWKDLAVKLQCPVDEDAAYTNDRWTNRDLIPIPPDRRTYKIWSFVIYWFVSGACISAYTTGSSLLAYGLDCRSAIACVVIGALITGILSVVSGMPGELHHIGFTVTARAQWGMKGGYFPVCLRTFTSVWWFGIQSYWGGQAFAVAIGAMSLHFKNMPSSIPASANITTQDLVGVIIWYIFYIPIVLIPPEKLQRPFVISSIAFGATLIGLLAWSRSHAGNAGPLWEVKQSASSRSYAMMLGITSILGSWGGGTIGQSDWVRYANRRWAPTLSQMIAAPCMITICAVVGVIVTSCADEVLGTIIWNPIDLLSAIQTYHNDSPGARAAVFFAAMGCAFAQLAINVLLNSVSTGMDMAGLWPKYINIRRGAYLLAAFGLASTPWNITASAATFLNVISGLGIFIAPMTGVMLCDFFVIRRMRLKIEDLYIGDERSVYWYKNGFHWRAIVAFVLASWAFCPGFIMTLINPASTSNWVKLFNISFLCSISMAFLLYYVICLISMPDNRFEGDTQLNDDNIFTKSLQNFDTPGSPIDEEKQPGSSEKDVSLSDKAVPVFVSEVPAN